MASWAEFIKYMGFQELFASSRVMTAGILRGVGNRFNSPYVATTVAGKVFPQGKGMGGKFLFKTGYGMFKNSYLGIVPGERTNYLKMGARVGGAWGIGYGGMKALGWGKRRLGDWING